MADVKRFFAVGERPNEQALPPPRLGAVRFLQLSEAVADDRGQFLPHAPKAFEVHEQS